MRRVPSLAFLFLVSLTAVLHAQSTNASLTGRITDPSKALIVEAKSLPSAAAQMPRAQWGQHLCHCFPPRTFRASG
jgi:hypothetical protein